jgi:7-keto-8-aminopelargonate synthetase-like enzyme
MYKVPPYATRANWVYEINPWQEVVQMTMENATADGRNIRVRGDNAIHFGNVSYMGLDTDERLKQAACEAIGNYGVQFSSSRSFVKLPLYDILEDLLAEMFGRPVIVTPTTTLAHQAAMSLFMHGEDAILMDYQAHASLQTNLEMIRGKGATMVALPHNDLQALEENLDTLSKTHDRVWYVADGIYSMFGDAGLMSELNRLLEKYENFYCYLDDAHGMSWTGKNGTGIVMEQMQLHERVILVTSLNKGFASGGGAVVCPNEEVKTWLKRCGSSLVFSGPLQPGALGAAIESAKIHLSPEITQRQEKVKSNINCFIDCAQKYNILLADPTPSPIFFVGIGKLQTGVKLCWKLREAGFFTNLGIFPAVPLNQTGIRISLNYHLEHAEIDLMMRVLAEMIPVALAEAKTTPESVVKAFAKKRTGQLAKSTT